MSEPRIALLAGTTGLVGRALLSLLLADESYSQTIALLRRPAPEIEAHPRLQLLRVDFNALPQPLPRCDDVYIALGTTIKAAGSQVAFRQVDFEAVVATARAARAAGASRLAVVSALGADPVSRVFYNRVKGEMEEAVAHLGYPTLVIARPSLLAGDRESLGQRARPGETWAMRLLRPVMGLVPESVRPIEAMTVARAMVLAIKDPGTSGRHVLGSAQMQGSAV
jgi:uncharacterized protein YbjT (DUF2867 family)